jgi:hypothetical protein
MQFEFFNLNQVIECVPYEIQELRIVGYPGHQPELDHQTFKPRLNTYETEQRYQYLNSKLKMFPFDLRKMLTDELGTLRQQKNASTAPLAHLNKQVNELPSDLHAKLNKPPSPSSFLNFDKNYVTKPDKPATVGKSLRWMDLEQKV